MSGKGHCRRGPVSGDMNSGALHSTGNSSGPSSLVTDANSSLSGDPRLQRSASINNETYGRLPASPLSFTSNNVSGSSVMDGSTILQQSPRQDLVQKQVASSATSQLMEQDTGNVNGIKRPRLGLTQDEIVRQRVIQQLLQRQDSMQSQAQQNLHLQSILQQQRSPQHQPLLPQQIVQSLSPMQRAAIAFQQQPQMRQQLPPQVARSVIPVNQSLESGICSRRLMQFLYHQRHRPTDNSILYWRKFVAEYFAPQAKERWCLSMYDNIGKQSLGVFPQSAVDAWQCDICGSKCGKGFEATFEVLPRLCQIKFDHGVIDENLFLDMPHESQLPTGVMILEYKKAVQECVYEHLRIVREGILRIIFTPELKILRWDFCARKHEEFISRRVLAPQVNQLLQVAQKYQNAAGNESGSAGVSQQDLQASCNSFLAAGRQLARNLELQSLNDLGFSKRYVRCLQISEVVNSMKDLIKLSQEHKIGPIESLKSYTRQAAEKLQKQKMQEQEQMMPSQNLAADQSTLNKVLGFHPGMSSHFNSNFVASNPLNTNQQSLLALNNYQNLLRSSLIQNQNHSQNQNLLRQEALSALGAVKQGQSLQFQGSASSTPHNSFVNTASSQYQQQPQFNGCFPQQNNIQPSQVNQQMQQQVFQQMFQDMVNNNRGASQPSPSTSNANINCTVGDIADVGNNGLPVGMDGGPGKAALGMRSMSTNIPNNVVGSVPRSNSFTSASSNPTVAANRISSKTDLADNLDLQDFDHIAQELVETGMFDDVDDNGDGCDWKV